MKKSNYHVILFVCIAVIIFLQYGCSKSIVEDFHIEGYGNIQTFEKLKNKINEDRKEIIENSKLIDISKYTADFKNEIDMFSNEEIKNITTYKNSNNVTKEEAIKDIETAFKLLKYSYGAYEYFGGDKAFEKAEKNIINKIKSINNDNMTHNRLERLFVDEMKFIKDGHFIVGYSKPCDYQYMYICSEYIPIYEKGNFYIEYKNGVKAQIVSINDDKEIDNYIKFTINDDGEICYGFISLFENNDIIEIINNMVVMYDNIEEDIQIKWNKAYDRDISKNESIYEKKIIDGISVYCLNEMFGDENLLKEFSDSAFEAKKEKIFIIDLRGNGGGLDLYANNWFFNYTGEYPNKPISSAFKITNIGVGMNIKESEYLTEQQIELSENGKWDISKNKGKWVENENLIIVLIDKNVASAGEDMIANLRTMENVIFVGSNSAGCYLSAGNSAKYLPKSGLYINYGYGFILDNEGKSIDGIGFLPDLWVLPSEALERTLKMIEFYNLK